MTPEQRGHLSKEILENPLVKEAFAVIEESIHEQWQEAPHSDMREELWYTLKGCQRFKQVFTIAIEQGNYEATLKELDNA